MPTQFKAVCSVPAKKAARKSVLAEGGKLDLGKGPRRTSGIGRCTGKKGRTRRRGSSAGMEGKRRKVMGGGLF